MILALHGKVTRLDGERISVRVRDIEYEVFVPINRFSSSSSSSSSGSLESQGASSDSPRTAYIFHHIRENEQKYFGFPSLDERDLFIFLLTIKGVGPQLALSLLGHLDRDSLQEVCKKNDVRRLQKIPRVGKVTAEMLIFELNRRQKKWQKYDSQPSVSFVPNKEQVKAMQALEKLGYAEAMIVDFFQNLAQKQILNTKPDTNKNGRADDASDSARPFSSPRLAEDWIKIFLRQT